MPELPASLNDVTLDWVKSVLADCPEFKDVSFINMEKKIRDEFSGLLSDSAILTLKTDTNQTYQMLAKIQASNEKQHAMASRYGLYQREVNFYNLLVGQFSVKMPSVYFAHYDEQTDRVTLLMEYLVDTYTQDVEQGLGLEEAKSAISLLAGFVSGFWDDQQALNFPWLPSIGTQWANDVFGGVRGLFPAFEKNFIKVLTVKELSTIKGCVEGVDWILQQLADRRKTLCHGDFWVDNLLFYNDRSKGAVAVDWQTIEVNGVCNDLAHLLTTSLAIENRRRWQDKLLEIYMAKLAEHGITDYELDELIFDIKISLMHKINYFVIGSLHADLKNERVKFINHLFFPRILSMIDDMDCLKMLPD